MKIFKGQGTADLGKPWRFEEDGLTVTRGCAWSPPGCHPTGCGIKTYVNSDGELVRVEGDENHPITNGRLCVRCLTIRDYVYNPDRVLYPMKRAREDRGKNKWERITWDEAYDTIAEKVKYFKEKYGAESILVMGGTGREGGPMLPAYAHACLGTPNACYTQSGYSCYIPRVAGTTYVMGATYPEMDYAGGLPGRYDDPMFTLPELIVFWGKEPLPSNGDGLFGHAAIDMMRRGSKLMSIDPRVNWVSTRADWHLRLRSYLDAIDDLDRAKSALAIDYCLAFLGYGVDPEKADEAGRNAAYPYESIYRTGAKSLGGDHCAEVSDVFRSCMFSPTRDRLIAEDHIACELEFMQYMANSELVALRDGEHSVVRGTQERELEFLENHLLSWVESFRNAVEQFAETDFYLGLLEMTQGWLELDAEYLRTQCANEEGDAQ